MKPLYHSALMLLLALLWPALGSATVLLNWNESGASGPTWPGWIYFADASGFGEPGWRRNDYDSSWLMPRLHAKTDYNNRVAADVDTREPAPGTSGASLKVSNIGGADSTAAWWYLWRDNFGTQGLANSATDRLSFYFRPSGFASSTWSNDIQDYNVHFGTYLCWANAGENCPKEAPGQHYYHWLTVNPDTWIRVIMDRHPQHQRGVTPVPANNPVSSYSYFENMNGFYLELFAGSGPQTYWVDELEFSQTTQPENDISIASLWVGYWPDTNQWEMGWMDGSFSSYGDSSISTFEIRWSTAPITNQNFASANLVVPEQNKTGTNHVRRPNSWKLAAWTRFALPVAAPSKVYFAVKDVSSIANGDGHNSPSANVKTIDYFMKAGAASAAPVPPPRNLRVF